MNFNHVMLSTHRKWENNKSSMRLNESNYIESFRLMIHLEEAAEQVQLEKCNQKNVKLYHVNENEFYFFVEVYVLFLVNWLKTNIKKKKFNSIFSPK